MKNKNKLLAVLVIAYLLFGFIVYYVTLPPLNWHAPEFWTFLTLMMAILVVPVIIYTSIPTKNYYKPALKPIRKYAIIAIATCIIFPIVMATVSANFFNAKEYAKRIDIEKTNFDTIKEVDFSKTPIIDRNTTEALGDRVMGQMSELVSQFNVSDEYTQISYKDSVYRVTPLEYADWIKWFANKDDGIPAYITVDSTTGKASLVKLKDVGLDNLQYVPSAKFSKNLNRHLRFKYPTEIFGSPSFELDEEGNPYYVCTTYTYKGVGNKKSVTGAIFVNPINGESKKYNLKEIPKWADRIYPESLIIEQIDDYGSLQKGFINSVIGQKGVIVSSSGYNYIEKDGDIWLYTGITSVNKDSSNLGFILVNMRTHEAQRIDAPGADETSAMKSAQDEVKNYGYEATFPVLVNVNGNPTYLMSLRAPSSDTSKSVIKMYAMVDASDYQKVVTVGVDEGLPALKKKMLDLHGNGKVSKDELTSATITITSLEKIAFEGNTKYYFTDENGNRYKMDFTTKYEEQLAFLKVGDQLQIQYVESEGIMSINKLK
ncbi:MAG: hypothetical protein EOM50_07985 [Erysipelotrichia bacterium]|nr:hypothetical protein [Erysipelotrichia bacterium]